MTKKLLVAVPDNISAILKKGEYTARYYNPGDLFDEVHILATNKDRPDLDTLQMTVGQARLHFHNLPVPLAMRTLGGHALLTHGWLKAGRRLAEQIQPALIRCHGMHMHTFLAADLKRFLDVPAVLSLHGNPDADYGRLAKTITERIIFRNWKALSERGLPAFDHVIAVYSPILPYLEAHAVPRYSVIYNVVGWGCTKKTDYRIRNGITRCICVGRQQSEQKDPRNILRAIADLPDVELHLYGDGDLHEDLKSLAKILGIADRVVFKTGLSNSELMETLHQFDIYVYNSINFEISKTVMEAALAGLPIVHNLREPSLSKELSGEFIYKVPNSVEGYKEGIARLSRNEALRKNLGYGAYTHATRHWAPGDMERQVVDLYRSLLVARQTAIA